MDKTELEKTFLDKKLVEDFWGEWRNGIIRTVSLKSDHEIQGSIIFDIDDIVKNDNLKKLTIQVYKLAIDEKDGNSEQQQTYENLLTYLKQ